jgi:fatty acid desaturase
MNLLSAKQIKQLSIIHPGRAELRLIVELSVILVTIYIAQSAALQFLVLPIVLALIGSRQHALLVLMHESAHRRISNSRFYNDVIGDFIAWNFFASMRRYRRHHMSHHVLENLNTLQDPDFARKQNAKWTFPMSKWQLLSIALKDLFLLNSSDYLQEMKDAKNNKILSRTDLKWQIARIAYIIMLFAVLFKLGLLWIFLIFWVLPILTTLKVIFRTRSIADHFCTDGDHPVSRTRTITGNWFDRLLIGPCSIGVPGPHHLYHTIPYYRLREAHSALLENAIYKEHCHVSATYLQALNECTQTLGASKHTAKPTIKVKTISCELELSDFQQSAAKHLGITYPTDYLKSAIVRCALDEDSKMVGGYIIQSQEKDIRVLSSLSDDRRAGVLNPIELTGLWLDSGAKKTNLRWIFWLNLCWDFVPYLGRQIVFSYSTSKVSLAKMYKSFDPQVLHCGIVQRLLGMSHPDHETICVVPAWKLVFLFLRRPSFFIQRHIPREKRVFG